MDGDLCTIVPLRDPQVEHLTEVGLVDSDHVLDVLDKVLLCKNADAFLGCSLDLILFTLAPQLGERARDGIVLWLHKLLLVVGELLVVVVVRHESFAHREFILFSDRLLDGS